MPIKVGMDETGHGRLQDSNSGSGVTVRSSGDSFVAKTMYDVKTGRKLTCIDLESTVSLFEDSVSGTEARIVFVDENGNEKQVTPLGGHFVDNEDSLQFGQGEDRVDIIMSSDACNTAVATPPYAPQDDSVEDEEGEFEEEEEDTGKDYELDIGLALEAATDASVPDDEQDSGIFKRGLRDPSLSVQRSTGVSSSKAIAFVGPSPSEVLSRHRSALANAKIASREGRKLEGDTTSFEMCTSGSSCPIESPTFFSVENLPGGSWNTYSVAFGDVDGDGDMDIVVGNSGEVNQLLINDGLGTFTAFDMPGGSMSTLSVAVGDVNNDGYGDIVIGDQNQDNQLVIKVRRCADH